MASNVIYPEEEDEEEDEEEEGGKTEVIKGPCGSVGMSFRQIPAIEGDVVHVSIETVTPNSPAALADLQRGDRLISIGGVKVTSSVQVPKLLKQAGEKVVVLYERPVRHQTHPYLGTLHEVLTRLEEPAFLGPQGPSSGYEEDPAPISTVGDAPDAKEMDSEFEELIVDPKPGPNPGANPPEARDDFLLTVNQSPKRTVANIALISPILNRKLHLVGLQSPLKPQPKDTPKPSLAKSGGDSVDAGPQRPSGPPPPPPARPPIPPPPRPQIKLTPASSETSLLEAADLTAATSGSASSFAASAASSTPASTAPSLATVEKSPEKSPVHMAGGEKNHAKATEPKPSMKQAESCEELSTSSGRPDSMKDKHSESTGSIRDSLEDNSTRESPETKFCNKSGRWSNASVVLEVERNHRYLNVALWCKDPFKLGSLLCLGHVSLRLEHVALECMATASAEYQSTFRLAAPEPRANVSRTALRNLSTHKGFNEKLCYGDITLNFCYLAEGEPDYAGRPLEREPEGILHDEEPKEREHSHVHAAQRDDMAYGALQLAEVRHNFQDTQFQNPTWCEYCKKKVPKLLKQAGEKVVVLYERPVRHQTHPYLGTLHEVLTRLEEPAFLGPQGPSSGYEEDPAPISTVGDAPDAKEMDSEFEELIVDPKPGPNPGANPPEARDDFLLTVNQSPKRTVANIALISPILNRKLHLVGLQSPLKPQPKDTPKPSLAKSGGDSVDAGPQRPSGPPPPPPARPPIPPPPRPQIKLTPASSETSLLEAADLTAATSGSASSFAASAASSTPASTAPSLATVEKSPEKTSETAWKTTPPRESPETQVLQQVGAAGATPRWCWRWRGNHRYLNVALWCKDPFKLGSLLCLGHVSLRLEHVALECMATASAEYQSTFRLAAPEPRANVSRTALRNLSTHKGFNEKLCYGDITLNFCYLADGEPDYAGRPLEREPEGILHDEEPKEREHSHVHAAQRDDMAYGALQLAEVRHNFQDTQFQNPTWCEYCKKKVWTKAASQCMICSYVCHKKCQDKCLAENPFCVAATDRRSADPEAKSTINRATSGLTRHIINTSSRLLNLRQVPKTRLAEQTVVETTGPSGGSSSSSTVEPSPKHTPNTSDNESSDTETYAGGASPSKQASAGGSGKLARREGGLDDSVFIAVKEIGRDLYRGLPTDERSQKLELMLDKLQQEIDQELERNNALLSEEREATDARRKAALAKSGERLQALTLLMIHYRAGIEDLESVESTSPSEPHGFKAKGGEEEESPLGAELYDSDMCSPVEAPPLDNITEEQICVEALH
ncbi:hypothetical protein CRUP_032611 [Coryphaenoides rupestris]|nr:hypothetical protein CRUP_032611 [Coryphaenoides rupestris]